MALVASVQLFLFKIEISSSCFSPPKFLILAQRRCMFREYENHGISHIQRIQHHVLISYAHVSMDAFDVAKLVLAESIHIASQTYLKVSLDSIV